MSCPSATKPRAATGATRRPTLRPARTYARLALSSRREERLSRALSTIRLPPQSGGGHQSFALSRDEIDRPRADSRSKTAFRARPEKRVMFNSFNFDASRLAPFRAPRPLQHGDRGRRADRRLRAFDDGNRPNLDSASCNVPFADADRVSVSLQPSRSTPEMRLDQKRKGLVITRHETTTTRRSFIPRSGGGEAGIEERSPACGSRNAAGRKTRRDRNPT